MKRTHTLQNLQWALLETDIDIRRALFMIGATLVLWLLLMLWDGWPMPNPMQLPVPENLVPLDQVAALTDVA